jgi:ubiquinone/menaquinone biosynthesis C-methylase UbiE
MSLRILQTNLNTAGYWDTAYRAEEQAAHARLFGLRLERVLYWVRVRAAETPDLFTFLDVGCGLCDLAKRVCAEQPTAVPYGVDISPVAVAHGRAAFPTGRFEVADAAQLPFAAHSFDFVWCGETLEHVEDPDAVVRETARVAAPQSLIVLSTPYKNAIGGPEHVWSHDTDDMLRWLGLIGGELLFLSHNATDDPAPQTMLLVVRKRS